VKEMAVRFPSAWLDELRLRTDIVQVASAYVQLKRNGHRYWGLCPFHNEKTASFAIDPESQFYYCFGCHAAGNVINLVEELERLSFQEAVTFLADRLHMPLPAVREDPSYTRRKLEREKILAVNKLAAQFYHHSLFQKEGETALAYLKQRGISDATVKKFGLGMSPSARDRLTVYLQEQGFSMDEILSAGLTVAKDGKLYDMFRNRIIFPIIDLNSCILGFGGRTLDNGNPKYLNTRETHVFNKRQVVYAANLLKKTRDLSRIILVEGYMDVISMTQHGISAVVATLGTAVTAEQARFIKRFAPQVWIMYDGDEAGQRATLKALDIFETEAISVKAISIPQAQDPDDYIRQEGADKLNQIVPINAALYRMRHLLADYDMSTQDGRTEYAKACALVLAKVSEPVELENHLRFLEMQTGFPRDVLSAQIGINSMNQADGAMRKRRSWRSESSKINESERIEQILLSILATGKLPSGMITEELFSDTYIKSLVHSINEGISTTALVEMQEPADRAKLINLIMSESDVERDHALIMTRDCIKRLNVIRLEEQIDILQTALMQSAAEEKARKKAEITALSKQLSLLKSEMM
jgi:DNA primase